MGERLPGNLFRYLLWLSILIVTTCATACTALTPMPTRAAQATVPESISSPTTSIPVVPSTFTAESPATNTPPFLLTPSPLPCDQPGLVEKGTFPDVLVDSLDYRIYLPPCYQENGRSYPTLYLLPGNNQSEAIWDVLGIDETAETAIKTGEIPPLLIVMPDGGRIAKNTSGGPNSYETLILNLVSFIESKYCVWPDRAGRAIGGLSRGGYWALEIAFRHPDTFSSVGGHSASLLDVAAGPEINPQFTGLNNDLGDLRIYLDIGQNDGGIHNLRKLHEDMVGQNITHSWALNEGGHTNEYWTSHLTDYINWYTDPWPAQIDFYPTCTTN